MKNNIFKSWHKVFRFTFKNIVSTPRFIGITLALAVLLMALPGVIMPLVELFDSDDDMDKVYSCSANEIIVVKTDAFDHEFEERYLLEAAFLDSRFPDMSNMTYCTVESIEEGEKKGNENNRSLILYVTKSDASIQCNVLFPKDTVLTEEDGDNYQKFLSNYSPFLFIPQTNLTISQLVMLLLPTNQGQVADDEDNMAMVVEVLQMAIPYLVVMFLYFMVLFYGQNISGSVLLEKTSKLVDGMLLSLAPEALVVGKVLAGAAAAILQFTLWLVSLIGGFSLGSALVKVINPDTKMALVLFFDALDGFSGMFSLWGVVMAVVIILLGFLIYCSFAAISGALASKQEDLASTQSIFVLVLVFGFFIALQGSMNGQEGIGEWTLYFPFTSIMILPGQLLLSSVTLPQALISMGILIITALVLMYCAGRIYKALVFYRGNVPKFNEVVDILLNRQK